MKSCSACSFFAPTSKSLGDCNYPLRLPERWPESVQYTMLPKKVRMRPDQGLACDVFDAAPNEERISR